MGCDVAGDVNLPSTLKIAAGMSFFSYFKYSHIFLWNTGQRSGYNGVLS